MLILIFALSLLYDLIPNLDNNDDDKISVFCVNCMRTDEYDAKW